jgi:hypothetical protein
LIEYQVLNHDRLNSGCLLYPLVTSAPLGFRFAAWEKKRVPLDRGRSRRCGFVMRGGGGALVADGGDWVRDASRPICRVLAAQWLELPESSLRDGAIDYVGCLLVHDPDRGTRGARSVANHLYEVRPDLSLALIN